jgi:hypothetical protein
LIDRPIGGILFLLSSDPARSRPSLISLQKAGLYLQAPKSTVYIAVVPSSVDTAR